MSAVLQLPPPTTGGVLSAAVVEALAARLDEAYMGATGIPKLTLEYPEMTVGDGYAVQWALHRRKLAQGHRFGGWKAGLTSRAKMVQMGVHQPSYGFLLDSFAVEDGGTVRHADHVHPRVEPEVAFITKRELTGPGCTLAAVLAATECVMPAIEIIDSRYVNFKFDLPSVVADNSSSSRFVLGSACHGIDDLDLRTLGVVFSRNGAPLAFGATAAVLGHPAASVAMLANLLGEREVAIPAGTLLMTGGITEAFAVSPGDEIRLEIQHLGDARVRFA